MWPRHNPQTRAQGLRGPEGWGVPRAGGSQGLRGPKAWGVSRLEGPQGLRGSRPRPEGSPRRPGGDPSVRALASIESRLSCVGHGNPGGRPGPDNVESINKIGISCQDGAQTGPNFGIFQSGNRARCSKRSKKASKKESNQYRD